MHLAIQARIYRLLCAAWRHRYLLIIPPLILPIVGYLLSTSSAKIYDNHTSFLIQESATLNPFLKDLSVETQIQQRIKALDTLLHSRHILKRVAEEKSLYASNASNYAKDQIIGKLSANLKVNLFGSDLIRISYRSGTPEGMSQVLKKVREVFIEQLLAPERSSMSSSEDFLLNQLIEQRVQLEEAEVALAKFKSKNALQLPSLFNNNVQSMSELRQLIADKEIELAGQQAVMDSLHTELLRNNPLIGLLENDIMQQKRELNNLLARYTQKHSKVVIATANLSRLEKELIEFLNITKSITSFDELERLWLSSLSKIEDALPNSGANVSFIPGEEIESAKLRYSRMKQELAQLKLQQKDLLAFISSSSTVEQQLKTLNRDIEVKKKVYQDTLNRHERAKLTGALGDYEQKDRIKVIDEAYTPSSPSNMPAILYMILGVIAGIGLGSGAALIIEITDSRLRYITDVQSIAGVPVLARIPKVQDSRHQLDRLLASPDFTENTQSTLPQKTLLNSKRHS
ncbi:GumC family protein [Marinomonas balearica]|uniref:Polysaccharide chain length determinant protein (PEP-CTERM system associated) n=1 Tax=Marinomonas balearica TaxID=491947 RepID=A0A4R6ML88_9GAMM|nr:GNVR domain-containing protein [Marinomonas balearica]TDP01070.1 polysaccharide chain length determinant protein (PEP-CTERM system associated) [Marinomonas balearica]